MAIETLDDVHSILEQVCEHVLDGRPISKNGLFVKQLAQCRDAVKAMIDNYDHQQSAADDRRDRDKDARSINRSRL